MLAPLLATLRAAHPDAAIDVTTAPAYVPLFSGQPYGVRALPFDLRETESTRNLLSSSGDGYDLAVVPGDNRYALLARAMGARWVVAFAGDRPAWKGWFVDESVPVPSVPMALADMFALLAGKEQLRSRLRFRPGDWAPPAFKPFDLPSGAYAVLHLGAGSPLRRWPARRWRQVADMLASRGVTPVWSTGPGEAALGDEADPERKYPSYAGTLDLAQLWYLLASARLVVCPDTGVAHVAKLTGTPTVCIFGQGSAELHGRGEYFADSPFFSVTENDFPCRDQRNFFKREVEWLRRCARTQRECPQALCIDVINTERVTAAIDVALGAK